MTWGKVSDDLHAHPKWRGVSPDAKAVWVTALSYCNAYLTNGLVDDDAAGHIAVEVFGPNPQAFERFAAAATELVEVRAPESRNGLWKATKRGFLFHQWTEHQPEAEDAKERKQRYQRRQQLHNTAKGRRVKAAVIKRDRSRCRYCGALTGPQGDENTALRTFDHVDPDGPNTPANIVIACGKCNKKKNARTPEDAGMPLLDEDNAERSAERVPSRNRRDEFANRARQGGCQGATGRDGSGRVGSEGDGPDRHGTVGDGTDTTDEQTAQVIDARHRWDAI